MIALRPRAQIAHTTAATAVRPTVRRERSVLLERPQERVLDRFIERCLM